MTESVIKGKITPGDVIQVDKATGLCSLYRREIYMDFTIHFFRKD